MRERKQLALQTFLLSWPVAEGDGIPALWFWKGPLELTNLTPGRYGAHRPKSPTPGTRGERLSCLPSAGVSAEVNRSAFGIQTSDFFFLFFFLRPTHSFASSADERGCRKWISVPQPAWPSTALHPDGIGVETEASRNF